MKDLSRRSFIQWVLSAGGMMACPVPLSAGAPSKPKPGPELHSETNKVCHAVRDGDYFATPEPSLKKDVVIIGGGPSGLAAADELKGSDWLLLEKEDHFGGNAYTETWKGLNYCTGSAWISMFSPEVVGLVKRWKLDLKPIKGMDAACFDGKWIPAFWTGTADNPAFEQLPYGDDVKRGMREFCAEIGKLDLGRDGKTLDEQSWGGLMKGKPAPLKAYWDGFGLSNWGAAADDTSAATGLEAATEWPKAQRYTFEGGLGMISRAIHAGIDKERLVGGAAVYAVRRAGKKVRVSFRKDGKDATVEAKAVIMATPKFITRMLLEGLPPKQYEAMASMRYAPYLVYNLCFDRVVFNQAYDNFVVGAEHFTDFIPADYVTHADGGDLNRPQVITVYAPLREEKRKTLLDDAGVLKRAQDCADELVRMFPGWADHLSEVRIYRRGHALPMSTPGWYSRLQKASRKDFGSVFFAHSDSDGTNSDIAYAALNGIAAAKKASKKL